MKPLVISIKDFRQTMQPNLYKEGLARIEHFENITGQATQNSSGDSITLHNGFIEVIR